ncbi:DUF1353 domain-containing protein [Pseudomonas cavernae]|uniref:DUF1353 domain-containing protein n=1 Tax=Pseudomonas cavernae TaxID=2320867 RepID=A0A385Z326_9PSED|nr:DUF1353 domain-containing protein [Pseudomonas cavernae]AYC33486.1 DUF1353 domain-containing protein [Pseudomonas cavernae]
MTRASVQRPLLCHHKNLLVTLLGALLLGAAWLCQPELLPALLLGGVLVYAGVALPLWVGRRERLRRAAAARAQGMRDWGFANRDRDGPWLNYIDYALVYDDAEFRGQYFYSEWLIVHDGRLIINPGQAIPPRGGRDVHYDFLRPRTYAWDGCSPKVAIYWLALVGSPDWWERKTPITRIHQGQLQRCEVYWPLAHHASLVHDALYQYLHVAPVSKRSADRLFQRMLRQAGLPVWLTWLYYAAVSLFGAPRLRNQRNDNSQLQCLTPLPGAHTDAGTRVQATCCD